MLERVAKGRFVKLAILFQMAALALPALPMSSCACSASSPSCCCFSGRGTTDHDDNAAQHGCATGTRSCCGTRVTGGESCCTSSRSCQATAGQCKCGSSCSCKSGFPPVPSREAPTTPDESSVVQQANGLVTVAVEDKSQFPSTAWQVEAGTAFSSLDRCINLSRFTL